MLRDKNLVPLSRQHQHALALCVRINRDLHCGAEVGMAAWQAEISFQFEQEITFHFAAEEKQLFPVAARFPELRPIVAELITEHAVLRDLFAKAGGETLDLAGLETFIDQLARHIRKEERELFEGMQKLMTTQQLDALGAALDRELAAATQACLLQRPAEK
jgi:hemerythrin-like domain-containing protein